MSTECLTSRSCQEVLPRVLGSRLTGDVREWAEAGGEGESKHRDISARLSHGAGSCFEKASRNLNIESIGVPESPHSILWGYDRGWRFE